jgi:hypothetical protein
MRRLRFPGAALHALAFLTVVARAEEASTPSAKERFAARKAEDAARQEWGRAVEARIQAWRRSGRFDEVRVAVDDALDRFPEPQALALVVGAVRYVNSAHVRWDAKPADVDAWNSAVALRALERLPRPPRIGDHLELVTHGVLGAWRQTPDSAADGGGERDPPRDLHLVARFVRRLLDDESRLWSPPRAPPRHGRPYPPVRRSDPRWGTQGDWDTPADEQGFLAYEEAWYATALRHDESRAVRDVRSQWSIPEAVGAFARRFGDDTSADAAYRSILTVDVPEVPWIAVLDAVRAVRSLPPNPRDPGNATFWVTEPQSMSAPSRGRVGRDLALEVHLFNGTPATMRVPLGSARAVLVRGEGPKDEDALPPRRPPLASDLVTIEPNRSASVPLAVPVRHAGLARVVVALDNDTATVGDTGGVWTGAERFVWYVDVPPSDPVRAAKLLAAARDSAKRPESVESLRVAVETLARETPDERCVEALAAIAVAATDARIAHAALAALEALIAQGGGLDACGAFAMVAADPARDRDVRARAVDGLARLGSARLTGRVDVGPQVREVTDVPIPPHVRTYVRERLQALARDADNLVAERAQAALGR